MSCRILFSFSVSLSCYILPYPAKSHRVSLCPVGPPLPSFLIPCRVVSCRTKFQIRRDVTACELLANICPEEMYVQY
jgi:hypothetical protein